MSRFKAAMEAWLRPISSVTMAGSVSIEPGGTLVRDRPDEIAACEDGPQRVPDQRIAPPHELQEAGTARRRRQLPGDVDEQPPAGIVHRTSRRQLPDGEPQGFHGVGHHLPMTD
jgi:hypothetical protein